MAHPDEKRGSWSIWWSRDQNFENEVAIVYAPAENHKRLARMENFRFTESTAAAGEAQLDMSAHGQK